MREKPIQIEGILMSEKDINDLVITDEMREEIVKAWIESGKKQKEQEREDCRNSKHHFSAMGNDAINGVYTCSKCGCVKHIDHGRFTI